VIPDELRQFIGKAEPPQVRDVERGSIRRYAEAVGNDNPLYYDEEYTRKSRYGTIIAPPGFWGWPVKSVAAATGLPDIIADLQRALSKAGYPRILDGGISYEFFVPIEAGDKLVASPRIKDIAAKQGKSGTMMMCYFETSYLNQNGDLVARASQTFIAR